MISGIYKDTIPNAAGCVEIITINLTVEDVDTSVTVLNMTMTSNASDATYRWLDCDNSYSELSGEEGQSFSAIGKGNYAVEITNAFGCVDTSACVSINIASIETIALLNNVVVFTNPTQENVNIDLAGLKNVKVQLLNTQGQVLFIDENINSSVYQLNLNSLKGTYILKNESEQISKVIKVIKL
ncbi:MAG: T9SS type A sorting domain-containing protein [Flavobacteriales bacterium]|nr:T9SS type A sorting domain-containing protein [Flavobacteriales bacterium]